MAFSNQRAVSDGSLQTIILSIAFFDKSEIRVYVSDMEKFAGVDFTWATSNSIQFPTPLPVGATVIIRRSTDLSEMRHIFTEGAQFTNQTLDEDYTQILHIAQESVEGSYTKELFNDLDMHGYRVRNMGPALLPGDAVPLDQVQAIIGTSADLRRAVRAPAFEGELNELPEVAARAGKVLGFDSAGDPIATLPASGSGTELALDLADPVTVGRGASMVGYNGTTVRDALEALEAATSVARTVSTVAAMQALTDLSIGEAVRTLEYHAGTTVGAGQYIVQATDPGWGIPLAGGYYGVLYDTFCITKFGVRNTLTDQTAELIRMATYADAYVYEIDFLGYSITVPDMVAYTSTRGTVFRGLTFYKVHRITNLKLKNPTGAILTQGWTSLQFIPKVAGTGLFELDNVEFDPYSASYSITSGEEDGALCGFACRRYMGVPALRDCNYNFKYTNVHFKSPAISYNINTADVLSNNVEYNHMSGEYWGLYAFHLAKDMQASEFHGWFRNDLHTGSGRVLVTSLIHDEAEIGAGSLVLGKWTVRDSSCHLFTTGAEHTVFKHHSVGSLEFQECHFTDIRGSVEFYSATASRVKELRVVRVSRPVIATIKFDSLYVESATLDPQTFNSPVPNQVLGTVEIRKSTVAALFGIGYPALTVAKLTLVGCRVDSPTEGIGRNGVTSIDTIQLTDCDLNSPYIIEAPFRTMRIDGCRTPAVAWANAIFNRNTTGNASVVVNNFIADATYAPSGAFLISGGVTQAVRLYHSVFTARPVIGGPNTLVEFGVYPPAPVGP